MKRSVAVLVLLLGTTSALWSSAVTVRSIRPEVSWVDCNFNEVWAFYAYPHPKPNGEIGSKEQITFDAASKIRILRTLLSPARDRYFYVSVVPNVEGLHRAMSPNYDDDADLLSVPAGLFRDWDKSDVAMYLHVHRLSGEPITTVPLQRSYWGQYQWGGWRGDKWVCLHERSGHVGGNRYCLFVNTETGQKRLIGLEISDEKATSDSQTVTFTHRGIFYVNFRPVYPVYGDELPDFGDQAGWKAYKESQVVTKGKFHYRKTEVARQEVGGYLVKDYVLTPDGKKAVLLSQMPPTAINSTTAALAWMARPPGVGPIIPRVVVVDLANVKATKDPKQYTTTTVLPTVDYACLVRDDDRGEIRVWTGLDRTALWRKSFAELAAP
jgi:hypothetical protein